MGRTLLMIAECREVGVGVGPAVPAGRDFGYDGEASDGNPL
jgi:hypothetical protein